MATVAPPVNASIPWQRAQTQLRTGLTSVLQDAGVDANLNFVTGTLNAGSRAGYDRVLDAVGVTTGEDDNAYVQLTPRLGCGNLENLSVWRSNSSGDSRSFDPASGFTRGGDDSQISLPAEQSCASSGSMDQ